jgi:cobalt-zinc-cadmium efflux system membrane fusion protein
VEEELQEPSDLDRLPDELFRATCEHGTSTFACDECRYEVGVVRVPSSVTGGGLVTTVGVERRRVAIPLELTGEVRFDDRRVGHVSSQVDGIIRVVRRAPEHGQAGQPLVEIESVAVGGALPTSLTRAAPTSAPRRERVARQRRIASEKVLSAKQSWKRPNPGREPPGAR